MGVDVEENRTLNDVEDLSKMVLACDEHAIVSNAITLEDRSAIFLQLWTRKEALLKATGKALGSIDLKSFSVLSASEIQKRRLELKPIRVNLDGRQWEIVSTQEIIKGHTSAIAGQIDHLSRKIP